MTINATTGMGQVQAPLHSEGGDGGSGGSGGGIIPAGTSPGATGGTPSSVAEPSVIDVDDNALIRVKGSDKPVKFGEHVKGFQAQHTRAAQKAAQLEKELVAERQRRSDYERRVQQATGQGGNQPNPGNQLLEQLKALPYLSGEQAVGVVEGITQQIKQRDMVTLALVQQIKQMKGVLDGLNQSHVMSGFDSKVNRWVKEANIPAEATEWVKKLYLAYEGDDLDQEFPAILKGEWENLNRLITSQRDAAARKAREDRLFVPGRGGNAGPNKPIQLKGSESPKDLADKLWEQFNESET